MQKTEGNRGFLEDVKVNVKLKISALWMVLLLLYIYVDIFSFYKPGIIEEILAGKVWMFDITQGWALGSMILMMIPSLMVFLTLALKASVNRWVNIVVGAVYIAVGFGTMIGETWAYYIVGHVVGVVLLTLIIVYAWRWPKQKTV